MENLLFDLEQPEYSYMIGFMQADGHLAADSRNRGRLSIELSKVDKSLLEKFQNLIPVNSTLGERQRNTNFKEQHRSVFLKVYSKDFRDTINYFGVPYGKKSTIIAPPSMKHSPIDYWRGIIDADGSVGFTAKKFPFISLVTASENLKEAYCNFVYDVVGYKPNVNKNKRDNVYNIIITREYCQSLTSTLYYDGCISLERKYNASVEIDKWIRPDGVVKKNRHKL